MKINQLAFAVAVLAFAGACGANAWAQTTAGPGTVSDSERESNRSGLTEVDRGSFDAAESIQGSVRRSAEGVSEMLRELRGTEQQQRSADMNVENLNRRRNARNRRRSQRNPPPPIHVQFRPSFSLRQTPSVQVAQDMQTRFSRLLAQRDVGSIQVVLSDRKATLTGTVKSEYERKLLERMVRIEPGVSAVENLIAIEEQVAAPQLAPAQ